MDQMQERLRYLLTRYASQDATAMEESELMQIFLSANQDEQLKEIMMEMMESDQQILELDKERWEPVLMKVLNQPKQNEAGQLVEMSQVKRMGRWYRKVAAASIILLVGLTTYFFLFQNKEQQNNEIVKTTPGTDVEAPNTARAIITLADGRIIYLDSAANGSLASIEGVQLVKQADGKIIYSGTAGEVVYNTLTNPRGSKVIDMTLSDGSRVWLNAGSSVTYPVAFVENGRKVSIDGEAYFEIAHDASKPFKVTKGDLEVAVLGTHFNVNTYDDEDQIKVTLLEGLVRVSTTKQLNSTILKPGQQAQVTSTIKVVSGVDTEEVMAWKNGLFSFKGSDIKTIMRELARWYDVDVEFNGEVKERFHVELGRNTNVSSVFKILETTGGVHFKIEGKKITVIP